MRGPECRTLLAMPMCGEKWAPVGRFSRLDDCLDDWAEDKILPARGPPEDKRHDLRLRSGGTPVFVDQTTEDVHTFDRLVADTVTTLSGRRNREGCLQGEALVRASGVVVMQVEGEDPCRQSARPGPSGPAELMQDLHRSRGRSDDPTGTRVHQRPMSPAR